MKNATLLRCGLLAVLVIPVPRVWSQELHGPALRQPLFLAQTPAAANSDSVAPAPAPAQTEPGTSPGSALPQAAAVAAEPAAVPAGPTPGPDMWHLPQPCFLRNMGITLGGWVDQGITFNDDHPANGFNGPVATNDLDSEYQLNQMWMFLERKVNTKGCGWDVGGRLDMIYGTDWRFGINHGLEDRINGFNYQTYGLVIPQMYAEVGYNDLTVKLGHFAAILDYEVVPAPANPFYSHSYSYGYTVPQLVTGVLGDYKLTDQLSLQGGFNRGWSMFEDYNDDLDFMGGLRWQSRDQRTTIAYAIDTGKQFEPAVNDSFQRFVYSLVVQEKLTKKLTYVLVQNLGVEDGFPPGQNHAEWYGINQYFLYALTPKLSANLRAEWLRDDDGARVAGPGNIPGVRAWSGYGFAGDFYEVTVGLNWRPNRNIMFRPELRYDWYNGPAGPVGLPFDNGTKDNQFLMAADLIFMF